LPSTQTPEICIDEFRDESEDGYASDSTSADSASELESCADTEPDTSVGQQSPPQLTRRHGTTFRYLTPFIRAK